MKEAFLWARKGLGRTSPNPAVGAVLVRGNRIVGAGFHRQVGCPHAEIEAMKRAGSRARGATLYVTLEPCSTYGRTPPCVDAVIHAGVRRVVFAAQDPNPHNGGHARKLLVKAGIQVRFGVLEKESRELMRGFASRYERRRPFVVLKMAQSLDGKIATRTGHSRWITSPASRRIAHRIRFESDAILVGLKTVLADNPSLDGRHPQKSLIKVILDSSLRIPDNARVFNSPGKVILACTQRAPQSRRKALSGKAEIWVLGGKSDRRVDLESLLRRLSESGVGALLVEGGGQTAAAFIEKKLVDELYLFVAPIFIGGVAAPTVLAGQGVRSLNDALRIRHWQAERVGPDLLIHAHLSGYPAV